MEIGESNTTIGTYTTKNNGKLNIAHSTILNVKIL